VSDEWVEMKVRLVRAGVISVSAVSAVAPPCASHCAPARAHPGSERTVSVAATAFVVGSGTSQILAHAAPPGSRRLEVLPRIGLPFSR
jgi:hypothetical protein